uniref:Uncharacterized protein n=1 Tax=Tetradesmus obliquus TaxID=3088 RepID=A0A383VEG1_TETOB|eukprot:jgi/Sobl393_1/11369/SZX63581.1
MEVFEPHPAAWYTASSPLPGRSILVGHTLVSNSSEGLLLALGGEAKVQGHAASADVWDSGMVATYDIRAGTWSKHPSGCTLPAADMPQGTSMEAVAADEHTIMLLRAAPRAAAEGVQDDDDNRGSDTEQPPGRVDLLDLRMLRGGRSATDVVSCYDLRSDSWSELPARLPLQLGYATPVVVRTPGAQLLAE